MFKFMDKYIKRQQKNAKRFQIHTKREKIKERNKEEMYLTHGSFHFSDISIHITYSYTYTSIHRHMHTMNQI